MTRLGFGVNWVRKHGICGETILSSKIMLMRTEGYGPSHYPCITEEQIDATSEPEREAKLRARYDAIVSEGRGHLVEWVKGREQVIAKLPHLAKSKVDDVRSPYDMSSLTLVMARIVGERRRMGCCSKRSQLRRTRTSPIRRQDGFWLFWHISIPTLISRRQNLCRGQDSRRN